MRGQPAVDRRLGDLAALGTVRVAPDNATASDLVEVTEDRLGDEDRSGVR